MKAGGRLRYKEPITSKWWFWTATSAVVVGGGATAIYLASGSEDGEEDLPDSQTTSSGYDVTMEI